MHPKWQKLPLPILNFFNFLLFFSIFKYQQNLNETRDYTFDAVFTMHLHYVYYTILLIHYAVWTMYAFTLYTNDILIIYTI